MELGVAGFLTKSCGGGAWRRRGLGSVGPWGLAPEAASSGAREARGVRASGGGVRRGEPASGRGKVMRGGRPSSPPHVPGQIRLLPRRRTCEARGFLRDARAPPLLSRGNWAPPAATRRHRRGARGGRRPRPRQWRCGPGAEEGCGEYQTRHCL